jgi:hypothetical protein
MRTTYLLATMLACASAPALAQPKPGCDVTGAWLIRQSNNAVVEMDVRRSENGGLVGSASTAQQTGSMVGDVEGRNVEFTIKWRPNKAVGVYQGRITRSGDQMMGTTYNQADPREQANWVVERRFNNCQ